MGPSGPARSRRGQHGARLVDRAPVDQRRDHERGGLSPRSSRRLSSPAARTPAPAGPRRRTARPATPPRRRGGRQRPSPLLRQPQPGLRRRPGPRRSGRRTAAPATASGSAVEVTRHQPGRRPGPPRGHAGSRRSRSTPAAAELDGQVGVQLRDQVPRRLRPAPAAGSSSGQMTGRVSQVPACDVEQRGLQRSGGRRAILAAARPAWPPAALPTASANRPHSASAWLSASAISPRLRPARRSRPAPRPGAPAAAAGAREDLGAAQLEQHLAAGSGRLAARPAPVPGTGWRRRARRGRAHRPRPRRSRSTTQASPARPPPAGARSPPPRRRPACVEHAGGALVPALPHRRGQVLVDRRPDQRMHEPQRPLAFDQAAPPSARRSPRRTRRRPARPASRPARRWPRCRARRPRGPRPVRRRASAPAEAARCARPSPGSAAAGAAPRRRFPSRPRRPGWPAAPAAAAGCLRCSSAAGCLERRRRVYAQRSADQFRARLAPSAAGRSAVTPPPRPARRSAPCRCAVPDLGSRTVSTSSTGQAFQPMRQVGDEPLRRLIRPVQVIDRQQQRHLLRDVGGQPVQAVQDRERVLIAPAARRGSAPGAASATASPASRGPPPGRVFRPRTAAGPLPTRNRPRTRRRAPSAPSCPPPPPVRTRACSSLVLPIPATPSTSSADPDPEHADSIAAAIAATSAARSSNWRGNGPPGPMPVIVGPSSRRRHHGTRGK